MENILASFRTVLKNRMDESRQISSQHFFKEEIKSYGIKASMVHHMSKEYFKLIDKKPKSEIFDLCENLWQSGMIEESFIACNWSYYLHKKYEPGDFDIFEKWIHTYVNNWASCDMFCNHTLGKFIEMYPTYLPRLKDLTKSDNRWMRRAAAVSLIIPARKGKFIKEILEIADILLLDKDDLVQKGYGWMLKAASKINQKEVFDYVLRNKSIMPRTALRYAIEKLPAEMKSRAMNKQM